VQVVADKVAGPEEEEGLCTMSEKESLEYFLRIALHCIQETVLL
jgi:hypothetical protein